MNVSTTRTITATVELDGDEAELLHEWMVRALRLTDGGYSCPLREALCITGRELADHLGNVLGRGAGHSVYPESDAERLVTERRVWQRDDQFHGDRCGLGLVTPTATVYCVRPQGHGGAHSAELVWG